MSNAEWLAINYYHLPEKSMDLLSSGVIECIQLSTLQHLCNWGLLLTS